MLWRMETWKIPNSMASEFSPANVIDPTFVVMPGMNPAIPTRRKTIPAMRAAFSTFDSAKLVLLGELVARLVIAFPFPRTVGP